MKRIKIVLYLSFLVILGITLINAGAFASEKVIKIGYTAPFTGSAAEFGVNGWRGIETALEEINQKGIDINGENYKIKIIRYDSVCRPSDGISGVRRLILQDKVVAILGDHCSSVCLAMAPLCDKYKVPGITIECEAEAVTKPGFDYYFRLRCPLKYMVSTLTSKIIREINPKTVSWLAINDDYGRGWVDQFEKGLAEQGVKTLSKNYFERGTSDFTIHLTKIKNENPDLVAYVGVTPEGAMILKQANQLGLNKQSKILGSIEMSSFEMLDLTSQDELNGTYAMTWWVKSPPILAKKVKEKYNAPMHYAIIFGYDSLHVLANAIERAQSLNPVDIRNALKEGKYKTLSGFTEFSDFDGYKNQGKNTPFLCKWENGGRVEVK